MRIALLPDGDSVNTSYRSIGPLTELSQRGHEVRPVPPQDARMMRETVAWCDVLHIHRVCTPNVVMLAETARRSGAAVVWDDDDDVARPPVKGNLVAEGRKGARLLGDRMKLFRTVDLVTTTNETLADVFRRDGAPATAVLENYVPTNFVKDRLPRRPKHIGWVASLEHRLDLERLPIASALERLLDRHADLHVTTLGIRLPLRSERYHHVPGVSYEAMLKHSSSFSIAIAPLAGDIAINHARSNIKVKEYAAVGVPWLASPIGPYASFGARQGGQLVADDDWFEELDSLLSSERRRRKLARRATRWGKEQCLTRNAGRWEEAFEQALARSHQTPERVRAPRSAA